MNRDPLSLRYGVSCEIIADDKGCHALVTTEPPLEPSRLHDITYAVRPHLVSGDNPVTRSAVETSYNAKARTLKVSGLHMSSQCTPWIQENLPSTHTFLGNQVAAAVVRAIKGLGHEAKGSSKTANA